jgi:DNA repair exonuclease SbcCD ATPase subunit
MEHLNFLTKTNVKDGDKVVYFYYNLPDTSDYSNFQTQAKPLIEELKEAMPLIKTQIVGMHEKIVKIINDDSTIINGLKQQLEKYKQDQQKVNEQIKELKTNNQILKRENQQLKLQTNMTNNTESQSLIEDLTKKADELAKDYQQAREAEDKLRDQLKEKNRFG